MVNAKIPYDHFYIFNSCTQLLFKLYLNKKLLCILLYLTNQVLGNFILTYF